MNVDTFWQLIHQAGTGPNTASQAEHLAASLAQLGPDDVELFAALMDAHYRLLEGRVSQQVYTLLTGSISDDGFNDFLFWTIACGRAFFEQALTAPDTAYSDAHDRTDGAPAHYFENESFGYVHGTAVEIATGRFEAARRELTPADYPLLPQWQQQHQAAESLSWGQISTGLPRLSAVAAKRFA